MTDIFDVMNRAEDVKEAVEEDFKIKALYSPFDFLNSINSNKNLFTGSDNPEQVEKEYNPWMVNRGLSYFSDTVEMANIINQNYHLDKKLQYDFLINTIRPKVRRSKWFKRDQDDDLDVIKEAFGYSERKAEVALSLLSSDQLKSIKRRIHKGGLK